MMNNNNHGDDSPSKCSRKTTLSFFFAIQLFAFTVGLLALLSPSWQFVYLENGRTEHHHGLWLDCKRDFSNEYGKTRDYYERLFRLEHQYLPFDSFFLTPLQCVYKFDYYIDTEDLFDHNHDENKLQDDANQHLFLGHKIAALAAFCVSGTAAAAALLTSICAFCHRSFIGAAAVLTSVAACFSILGISIFFIWANYQDNNIIKDDDGEIYEQYYGWAFYLQIAATIMYLIASMLGCLATSISHHKGKAKLVKIEVVESDDTGGLLENGSLSQSQPFKRSFSAIYRVDSTALRQWERDYLKKQKMASMSNSEQSMFKRTSSMPNIKKNSRRSSKESSTSSAFIAIPRLSTSNVHRQEEVHSNRTTITTFDSSPMLPSRSGSVTKLKSALKPPRPGPGPPPSTRNNHNEEDDDLTYEYVPFDRTPQKPSSTHSSSSGGVPSTIQLDSFTGGSHQRSPQRPTLDQSVPVHLQSMSTAMNVYDQVYTPKPSHLDESYMEPKTITRSRHSTLTLNNDDDISKYGVPLSKPNIGSSKSVNIIPFPISRSPPDTQTKSTLIDDIVRPSTAVPFGGDYGTRTTRVEHRTEEEESIYHQLRRQHQPVPRPVVPKKPAILTKANILIDPSVYENESNQRRESIQSDSIRLNTFSVPSTSIGLDTKRSLTTLSGRFRERVHEFDRPDSTDYSSTSSPQPQLISSASPTGSELLQRLERRNRLDRQNVIIASALPRRNFLPDEVDRSIGSSTLMDNNDVMSETPSDFYQQAAELRLNLFLTGMDNGSKISIDSTSETTV